jgi:hypothetical protein
VLQSGQTSADVCCTGLYPNHTSKTAILDALASLAQVSPSQSNFASSPLLTPCSPCATPHRGRAVAQGVYCSTTGIHHIGLLDPCSFCEVVLGFCKLGPLPVRPH